MRLPSEARSKFLLVLTRRHVAVQIAAAHHQRIIFNPINLGDIGVIHRRQYFGLALEPRHAFAVVREGFRQDLDRDVALEPGIPRAVNLAHSAGTDRPEDFLRTEFGAPPASSMAFNEAYRNQQREALPDRSKRSASSGNGVRHRLTGHSRVRLPQVLQTSSVVLHFQVALNSVIRQDLDHLAHGHARQFRGSS